MVLTERGHRTINTLTHRNVLGGPMSLIYSAECVYALVCAFMCVKCTSSCGHVCLYVNIHRYISDDVLNALSTNKNHPINRTHPNECNANQSLFQGFSSFALFLAFSIIHSSLCMAFLCAYIFIRQINVSSQNEHL